MAIHTIFRADKLKATKVGHIYSVMSEEDDLDNGSVITMENIEGEFEIKKAVQPVGTEEPVVIVYQAELIYDESKKSSGALENFYNEAGKATRAYELSTGDIFSVSPEGIDALDDDVVVGQYVVAQAGSYKLAEIATPAGTEAFVGRIIDVENFGTSTNVGQAGVVSRPMKLIGIEVVKNYK